MTRQTPEAAAAVLREADRAAWLEYVQLERDGVRHQAQQALLEFNARLSAYSVAERRRFAEALLEAAGQRGGDAFTIRPPLWNEHVFPVLLERWDKREPDAARTLLSFLSQIHGGGLCEATIGDRDLSQLALIERALQHEPDSRDLKRRWLDCHASRFDYAIHELPDLFLWGEDATPSDYQLALASMDRFERYAADLGVHAEYADALAEWRYYFSAYCAFLEIADYATFADYLEAHPMDGD